MLASGPVSPRIQPVRGVRNAARRLYETNEGVAGLRGEIAALSDAVAALTARLDAVSDRLDTLDRAAAERAAADRAEHARAVEILEVVRNDEPAHRQELWRLRATSEYERAYEDPEPLVSVCIATYANTAELVERTIPSILGQTYERFEVVIVGDAVSAEAERAIRGIDDERVTFVNLPMRGPYPPPPAQWLVAGGPPSNEAHRLARGDWICAFDDDDAFTADHIEKLLAGARERRLELCYGQVREHHPDGGITESLMRFPPQYGGITFQATIMHAQMRFVCAELGDALFDVAGDWARISRMLRIGVRMGMIDDVVADIWPSRLWRSGPESGPAAP